MSSAVRPGANEALARRLRRLQRLSQTGGWEWDLASGALAWSPETSSMLGLAEDQTPTYELYLTLVHPDDRSETKRQFDQVAAGKSPYDISHRVVRPNGAVRHIRHQGEVELDRDGRPAVVSGAVRDVTDIYLARAVSRSSQEMLAGMLRISPEAVLLCGAQGRILAFSTGAEALFGYAASEVVGQTVEVLMPERFRRGHARYVSEFNAGSAPNLMMHERAEIVGRRRNGEEFPAEASLAKLQTPDGFVLMTVVRDLTERRTVEATLIEAREQSERASQAKSSFLANMSHEIRTPLNGVLGVAGALALTDLNPRQREMLALIETSGRALQSLLGDILDLSKIDAGGMQLRLAPFSLERLLEETVALFRASAAERGVALRLSLKEGAPPACLGDELRIRQVLSNLVSNAVKFTSHGRIEVAARLSPGSAPGSSVATFQVSDTGVGFAPEVAERLFERFEQADGSITRSFGGTGLGLAISKALVELMGGQITAEGRPGQGATFVFTVPLQPLGADLSQAAPAVPEPAGRGETVNVLLAEDHPINRMAVEYIFEGLPVSLVSVGDGAQAVEAARERPYDLVLMDMQMPVMDGLTAIRHIREEERSGGRAPVHICVLTANAFDEHRERAQAAGADSFLTKPVQIDRLLELVSEVAAAQPG